MRCWIAIIAGLILGDLRRDPAVDDRVPDGLSVIVELIDGRDRARWSAPRPGPTPARWADARRLIGGRRGRRGVVAGAALGDGAAASSSVWRPRCRAPRGARHPEAGSPGPVAASWADPARCRAPAWSAGPPMTFHAHHCGWWWSSSCGRGGRAVRHDRRGRRSAWRPVRGWRRGRPGLGVAPVRGAGLDVAADAVLVVDEVVWSSSWSSLRLGRVVGAAFVRSSRWRRRPRSTLRRRGVRGRRPGCARLVGGSAVSCFKIADSSSPMSNGLPALTERRRRRFERRAGEQGRHPKVPAAARAAAAAAATLAAWGRSFIASMASWMRRAGCPS